MRFLENTKDLALATEQGTISLYKLETQSFSSLIVKDRDDFTTTEGGIVNCYSYLGNQGQNVLVYATRQGKIHVHDVRFKKNVSTFNLELQRGLASCFSVGQDENSFFIGTINGYVATYDLRFNLISSIKRHSRGTPITDMCCYFPDKSSTLPIKSPKLFVASSSDNSQVDLYSMDQSAAEWSFVVGNPKHQCKAYTPYRLSEEESSFTDTNRDILKRLTKGFAVANEELKSGVEVAYSDFAFQNFYKSVKDSYEESTWIYKLLCPRVNRSEESMPFLLTAGADRIVRYWYLGNLTEEKPMRRNAGEMTKQSFIVNSPDSRQVEYLSNDFCSKVIYESLIRENSKERNGQALWQHSNGKVYLKSDAQRISTVCHSDAILNMELLDTSFGTYLITCGRDNEVKIWS
eukprot:TRINITY_DN13745_c0_g1_i4.p1 TRINITY_DN13745_c0_g1~~TRINITY_DN13745_c0_g1_i4.p1  ORF type:complete len:405 (-),score=74.03 TRINITY_DN13745_c0_g1_i4:67-1281(-)